MFGNYLGISSTKGKKVYILPVPYESTVSYRTGTREGPLAVLRASYEAESWDEELKVDLEDVCSFEVLPFFEPVVDGPGVFLDKLLNFFHQRFSCEDFVITLGGEHTVAIAPISFYKKCFPDLVVLQMDAHADLRDEYQGSKYSHACVMRRIWDIGVPFAQVGVRSLSKTESIFVKQHTQQIKTIFSWDLDDPDMVAIRLKDWIGDRKVYITFDVDVMDPSILPGTGTPEPHGLDYKWVNDFFKFFIPNIDLVGFDVCELSPTGVEVVSESVVVRIINRILASLCI